MTLTSKMNLNNKSLQSLKRSLRMEALETRQMLSAVSPFANAQPVEEADSAYVTDLQPTGAYTETPWDNPFDAFAYWDKVYQDDLKVNTGEDIAAGACGEGVISFRDALAKAEPVEKVTVEGTTAINLNSDVTITGSKAMELNGVPFVGAEVAEGEEPISINIENAKAFLQEVSFQNVNLKIDANSEVSIYTDDDTLMINGEEVEIKSAFREVDGEQVEYKLPFRMVNGTVLEDEKFDWYTPGDVDMTYVLETAEDFAAFTELVEMGADFDGLTVKLGADLDLEGLDISAICSEDSGFLGTLVSQDHVISNAVIDIDSLEDLNAFLAMAADGVKFENTTLNLGADLNAENEFELPEGVRIDTNGFNFRAKISSKNDFSIDDTTLGASEEALTIEAADGTVTVFVTTGSDTVSTEDGVTSLREALAVVPENAEIAFDESIDYITIGDGVLDGAGHTLTGVDVNFDGDSGTISGFVFDGVSVENWDGSLIIADTTFTGDYSDAGFVVENWGEMILENVSFTDIFADIDLTEDEWYGMDGYRGYAMDQKAEDSVNSFIVIDNWGDMEVKGVEITGTDMTFTTDRLNNFTELDLIANNVRSSMSIDGLLAAENTLNAETNRGDISAFLYGVRNEGIMDGANIIMFGNAVSTAWDTRFADIEENMEEGVYGIATYIKDVQLTNVTMLEKLYGYRADFYMANSIYSSANTEFERGFLVNAEIDGTAAPNLDFAALADLEAIFPFFDAETNTFELNADGEYDLRMWLDSEIVDAGNNDFSAGLTVDVLGNNRFNNNIVDLGAVESNAQKLTVDGLVATPDGTDTAILTWRESANASGYVLRYYTGTEAKDSIADNEWTETIVDGLEDLQHIVDGLDPRTWVAFQVMALGDNLSWIDSDWSETASCWTKSPFPAPVLVPSLESPLAIDLAWPLVPGASESVSDVPYTLEFCIGTMEDLEAGKEFTWTALPNAYSLGGHYGSFLISEALDGIDLEYSTTYLFRVKVNGVGEFVDSEWSYAEKKTGAKLEAPALKEGERTDSAITVTWNDTTNRPSQVKAYKVQYREAGSEKWIDLEVPAGADVDSITAENLKSDTSYEFRIMVTGQKVYNQADQMADDSEWSDIFTFKTKVKLNEPEVTASANSSSKITVMWTDVENEAGYRVTVKDADGNVVAESDDIAADITSVEFSGLNADTTYTVEVVAVGTGEYLDSESGTDNVKTWIKLTAPVMTQDSNSETHVTMTWEAVQNSTDYEVMYSLTGPDADDFELIDENGLTITITEDGVEIENLDEVRQIWFKIRALGQDGVSEDSEWSTVYVGSTKGKLVFSENGLKAEGTSTSTIQLTWDAVAGAQSYMISYKTGNGNEQWITVDDPEATTTTISGLDDDTLYDVTIQAMGDGVNTVSSEVIAASAATWLQLAAPSLTIDRDAITDTTISGSFNAIDFATGYVVEFSADGGQTWTKADVDAEALTFTANVAPNTTYVFRVMAEGSAPAEVKVGEVSKISVDSEWNQYGDRVTSTLTLAVPEIEAEVADTQKSVTLTWTAVENAAGYWLVVMDASGKEIFAGNVDDTTKVLDIDPNRQYTATVKALGNGDNIKDSAEDSCDFETKKIAMGAIDLNAEFDGSNDSINLNWNAVEGAASYTLKYQKAGEEGWTTVELGADVTSWTLTKADLEYKTTYNFEIIANASADYTGTPTDTAMVEVPAQIEMTAVILRNPSAAGTDTIPTTEKWVDEWTNVFLEVWVEDTTALVEGRVVEFSLTIDPMYDVKLVDNCAGVQIEKQNDGSWKVTVESGDGIESPARLACFKLTVNTENGVSWETQKNTEAFKFKGEAIGTTVYAVPGDMNDDGAITMTQNQADDARFDDELGKEYSWADFDHDGDVDLYDRQWMLDNNQSQVWYDAVIKYTDDAKVNGPFMHSPVAGADAGLKSTAGVKFAMQEMPEARVFEIAADDREEVTVKPLAVDEADPIPVVKDINTLSGNGKVKEEAAAEIGEQAKNTETQVLDLLFGANVDFFA
ncbi:MAG: fibronectin type III domain-containing protein [Thermoguttaceae bacterium]|nr:fibronectin type III domain-containing protein [Thermoguttaceae bacterium]